MGYLPIFIDVSGRACVVIGGGEVAERKVRSLIEAGATVVVVSPTVTPELAAMSREGTLRHIARKYQHGDLAGAWLVFEATGDGATARMVAVEADERCVPINVADVPELCTFIVPAVVQRGGLQVAISTGGASPALARKIREELEESFGAEYELTIELLADARRWLRAQEPDLGTRARVLSALVNSDLRECLKRGDFDSANEIVKRELGVGLDEIGFDQARIANTVNPHPAALNGRTSESR
ncbi:MAG: bifunctional precorrin-2 dehydrogenase/sirohydrochlorin ferrochelatase [Deltaproteobacteria bacterium]|nr:bifunctional precorrin-2 dehydrogenase/sirohydrochlorin ferrochelatase [Deltaproteobacteria bacterium]